MAVSERVSLREICEEVGVAHIQVTEVLRRIEAAVREDDKICVTQEVGTFYLKKMRATTKKNRGVTYPVPAREYVTLRGPRFPGRIRSGLIGPFTLNSPGVSRSSPAVQGEFVTGIGATSIERLESLISVEWEGLSPGGPTDDVDSAIAQGRVRFKELSRSGSFTGGGPVTVHTSQGVEETLVHNGVTLFDSGWIGAAGFQGGRRRYRLTNSGGRSITVTTGRTVVDA